MAFTGMMPTHFQKWAISLGSRIPRSLAEEVGVGPGSEVSLSAHGGESIVEPSFPARITLEDLLAAIMTENVQIELETEAAIGGEIF